MSPQEADEKQKAYRRKRLRWAREIGLPVRGHEVEVDPAVIDAADPEDG